MVVWVTGLSGSGKSTLCAAIRPLLQRIRPNLVTLDGDAVRAAFGEDLGFHEADRVRQIKRIQGVSKLLADQGIAVLVAALYAHPDLLAWNRANLPGYFEVYLKTDVDFLLTRDGKKLYSRSRCGEIPDVVGVDIPWRAPQYADLVIDASSTPPVDALAEQIVGKLAERAPSA